MRHMAGRATGPVRAQSVNGWGWAGAAGWVGWGAGVEDRDGIACVPPPARPPARPPTRPPARPPVRPPTGARRRAVAWARTRSMRRRADSSRAGRVPWPGGPGLRFRPLPGRESESGRLGFLLAARASTRIWPIAPSQHAISGPRGSMVSSDGKGLVGTGRHSARVCCNGPSHGHGPGGPAPSRPPARWAAGIHDPPCVLAAAAARPALTRPGAGFSISHLSHGHGAVVTARRWPGATPCRRPRPLGAVTVMGFKNRRTKPA
jgi:hypothetical protein